MNKIEFGFYASPFGQCFVVFEGEKVLFLAFLDCIENAEKYFREQAENDKLSENAAAAETLGSKIFSDNDDINIVVGISGTDFQVAVWNALLAIPRGETRTYKQIAEQIGHPSAVRAVANAVGDNPVSYLIPCHRVIRTDGGIGGYRWGVEIKKRILKFENAEA
ncbi:MAG: methylated-DNA--[protein]-cysteine S-methyltransferase [Paludibacter sp.]|jgi:O-6-methylguanine DNA methyltransferase|nr:methylated-DNA--[protein]-cysteine S-methyltransferase [Paludibacter sp.]